jgi:glutaredoxin
MANQTEILMYGALWCGDCRRAKQFFDKHNVAYRWIDLEQNPQEVAVVHKYNDGKQVIPTILFPDGSVLIEPNNSQLAEKLNISM